MLASSPSFRPFLIAGALALLGAPADADTLRARYNVTLLSLPIGAANYTVNFDPASYHIDVTTKLSGLAAMMSSSKGAATATGALAPGRVTSANYATTSADAKLSRTVRMLFSGGVVKGVDIAPPFDELPGRIPLTAADKTGVIDPLSATLLPVPPGQATVGPAACNRTVPIFDGFVRFNVNLTYVGSRQVKIPGYKGPVSVCAARYVPLAGHRPERAQTKFMVNNKQIEVWLAPVEKAGVAVPFRISVLTQIGTAVIEAQELSFDTPPAQANVAH